ncbi:MAG: type I DNA topoisomerase [Candidatus Omnitrophota bacterium]
MAKKNIVIVESPAKAKTIEKFLGSGFSVTASGGHIADLPKTKLGVEIKDNEFVPSYIIISAKRKSVTALKKKVQKCDTLYLAADPDREGEAICWHLARVLGKGKEIKRVLFYEITKQAILDAFKNPIEIDQHKVDAQQARRILDRLVGYGLSPLLWQKITRGLSAGRVQSVALRLIVDREKEIKDFNPEEYWELEALLKKIDATAEIKAKLQKINNEKPGLKSEEEISKLVEQLKKEKFFVSDIKESAKKRNPSAPYTTSKLQQDAFNVLRFPAAKTMRIAQQLYEGIELENSVSVGLITYMRTDSVRISQQALDSVRNFINAEFGAEYVPETPVLYKTKKNAQAAHEAVRPTYVERTPESLEPFLNKEQLKLYTLIWNKFVSSQMSPALISTKRLDITAGNCLFAVSDSKVTFPGFLILSRQEEEKKEENKIPEVTMGEVLELISLNPSQHFTQPPPRYTDASLVKILEEKGIGRPSTYAPIIHTILMRNYVQRQANYLLPTELGIIVIELLLQHFPRVMDVQFTAELEEELDAIEEGNVNWQEVLKKFYTPFSINLEAAKVKMREVKKEVIETDEICPKCGRHLVVKWGRLGKFLSCAGFPDCIFSKSISLGIPCPKCKTGDVISRKNKRGRYFYGCSRYPECDFISNKMPQDESSNEDKENDSK